MVLRALLTCAIVSAQIKTQAKTVCANKHPYEQT
jgi:hypothetical protein